MKLYFSPGACSLAGRIALHEASLAFTPRKVDLRAKTVEGGEDFTTVNPKGYVPALELDEGEVLTENIAVLAYIGSKAPTLFPGEGLPHWRVLEALAFISTELHKGFKPFFDGSASDAERDKARKTLSARFGVMDAQLVDRAFILGESFSVVDCYLFVTLFWATEKVKLDLPERLTAYYRELRQRPSVARSLREEGLA